MAAADDAGALPGRTARRGGGRARVVVLRLLSIVLFFLVWYAVSLGNAHVWKAFNPILLPPPDAVLRTGIEMTVSGDLQHHILASLARVMQGFGLAALMGVLV